jgi:hypothetical protein
MPELTRHLCLEDHPHADALAVQYTGGQHGFDCVPNRVTKINEVAQPSRFAFIVGDYMRFD